MSICKIIFLVLDDSGFFEISGAAINEPHRPIIEQAASAGMNLFIANLKILFASNILKNFKHRAITV